MTVTMHDRDAMGGSSGCAATNDLDDNGSAATLRLGVGAASFARLTVRNDDCADQSGGPL